MKHQNRHHPPWSKLKNAHLLQSYPQANAIDEKTGSEFRDLSANQNHRDRLASWKNSMCDKNLASGDHRSSKEHDYYDWNKAAYVALDAIAINQGSRDPANQNAVPIHFTSLGFAVHQLNCTTAITCLQMTSQNHQPSINHRSARGSFFFSLSPESSTKIPKPSE